MSLEIGFVSYENSLYYMKFDVNTLNPFRIFFNTHLNPITENLALSSRYFAYLLYFYFQETMANGITYHIQKTL